MHILVTGAAGFIGYHVTKRLLSEGHSVTGIDNLNTYYDATLKQARLKLLSDDKRFQFVQVSIEDRQEVEKVFVQQQPISIVIHLAAQAGVRYSLTNPQAYIDSNIVGFMNVLECCRHHNIEHLIYASSSSVYGANTKLPFSVHDNVDHPVSLYAATKKANELMAHTYSHLFGLPTTGLRFFTVYGPWGRPDMSYFLFTKAILAGKSIQVFNHGLMKRDFTYIDDIVEGIVRLVDHKSQPNPDWDGNAPDSGTSYAPYRIYNIGNNRSVELSYLIEVIEKKLGKQAIKVYLPLQAGDVPETYADVDDLMSAVGFKPNTSIEVGIGHFVDWYRSYYG
ncbi:MAG TPA: NAD-dependent epimerase [Bacilli bacterium]